MQTLTSRDVQTRFGAVLDLAKREPITITQYGRPVIVMMSVEDAKEVQQLRASRRFGELMVNLPLNPSAEQLSDADITKLVHELR
jgi:prevent-host-death family protein